MEWVSIFQAIIILLGLMTIAIFTRSLKRDRQKMYDEYIERKKDGRL